jgi:hypothetical protein
VSKPNILHLGAGVIYGGVESFLSSLARHSSTTEPEFALCATGRLQQEVIAAGRRVEVLPPVRLSNPWQVWRARRDLGRVLDSGKYQLAMSHSGWMQILFGPVLRRRGLWNAGRHLLSRRGDLVKWGQRGLLAWRTWQAVRGRRRPA